MGCCAGLSILNQIKSITYRIKSAVHNLLRSPRNVNRKIRPISASFEACGEASHGGQEGKLFLLFRAHVADEEPPFCDFVIPDNHDIFSAEAIGLSKMSFERGRAIIG